MWLSAILLLGVIVVTIFYSYLRNTSKNWKMISQFPGDKPLPLFGNALQVGFDADQVAHNLMDMWSRHGKKNFRIIMGNQPWVMLCEPADIAIILTSNTELSKPAERNAALKPFFGNSVSTSEGERWKSTRRLMSGSFHFKTLDQRLVAVNEHCVKFLKIIEGYEQRGEIMDLYRYARPLMCDIFMSTLMGVENHLLDNPDCEYLVESRKLIRMLTTIYYSYWRNIDILFRWTAEHQEMMKTVKAVKDLSTHIINTRRAKLNKIIDEIKQNNPNLKDGFEKLVQEKVKDEACLLDELLLSKLPNGEPVPDSMINEEICLLNFTGHYTTSLTMSHALYFISTHPEVHKRIMEEQTSIFGKDLRDPTNSELNQMKYLEATVKETMRLVPTITKVGRVLKSDMELKDGRIIPAGTSLVVYLEALFLNPEVFPEPKKFNPDRFFDHIDPFGFVPFSAGPRNCLGFRYAYIAIKATLSNLLRRYEVLPAGPEYEPIIKHRIITESENGIRLRFKKRVF